MSSYANMTKEEIADTIVKTWELIHENAQMQRRAREDNLPHTVRMLEQQGNIQLARAADLGLALAKNIIAEAEKPKCDECSGTGLSMLSMVKPNTPIKCPKCGGTGVVNG